MSIQRNTHRCFYLFALIGLAFALIACGETTTEGTPAAGSATPAASEAQALPEQETSTPESTIAPTETLVPMTAPTDTPEPTATPTDTPEPQSLYLRDIVEHDGYLLSAVTVEDPTTPGMFYEPESGKKLVAVQVIVGNVSGETLDVNPLYATLVDSEGFVYQPELAGRDGQIITVGLGPGEKAEGWIAFEIPEEATAASIKYATEVFGDSFLQASLAPRPEGSVADTEALSVAPPAPETRLGEVLEQDGLSLAASVVEDPTTPGMLYEPKEGYKLVAVELVVGNISSETLSVNPLSAYLIDNGGFVYQVELGGRDGQIATTDLGAGEKTRGWVAFSIREDAIPASIKYLAEVFSDKFLQVGLAQ